MCGISNGLFRQGSGFHDGSGQVLGLGGGRQNRKISDCRYSPRRGAVIASLCLIHHDLEDVALELLSLATPPLRPW